MKSRTLGVFMLIVMTSWRQERSCKDVIVLMLERHDKERSGDRGHSNSQSKIEHLDTLLMITETMSSETDRCKCVRAHIFLQLGEKEEAVSVLDGLIKNRACERESEE